MYGCRILCRMLGVRVEAPQANADVGMIVANHFGIIDPLVLASKMPVAFVAKAEIERWPFVGWVTRTMGVIFVHRDRVKRTTDFVEQVRQRMSDGVTVLVFPEGTTSQSDEVQAFKTGSFAAIEQEPVQVTPLHLSVRTVNGRPLDEDGRDYVVWAQSPRSFMEQFFHLLSMREATFVVRIGEPVDAHDYKRKELAVELRNRVARLAAQWTNK
jgi:lyso-ornithine lipid O-acyltransferase